MKNTMKVMTIVVALTSSALLMSPVANAATKKETPSVTIKKTIKIVPKVIAPTKVTTPAVKPKPVEPEKHPIHLPPVHVPPTHFPPVQFPPIEHWPWHWCHRGYPPASPVHQNEGYYDRDHHRYRCVPYRDHD